MAQRQVSQLQEACHSIIIKPPTWLWREPGLAPYVQCVRRYGDLVSAEMQTQGRWLGCDNLYVLWHEAQHDPGLFVDVGANIGACTLALLAVGARVVAFEPLPSNFWYLNESMRINAHWRDRLILWPVALGARNATEIIYTERGNAGNSPLRFPTHAQDSLGIEVSTITLDHALWPDPLQPAPRVGLLKIDVQGFEPFVLEGATRLLQARAILFIQMEVASEWLLNVGRKPSELCQILSAAGFTLYVLQCAVQPVRKAQERLTQGQCQRWDSEKVECEIIARRNN